MQALSKNLSWHSCRFLGRALLSACNLRPFFFAFLRGVAGTGGSASFLESSRVFFWSF